MRILSGIITGTLELYRALFAITFIVEVPSLLMTWDACVTRERYPLLRRTEGVMSSHTTNCSSYASRSDSASQKDVSACQYFVSRQACDP